MTATRATPTKSQRKRLRQLVGDVYEAELAQALASLEADFKEWRRGEILASQLNERVHDYHQDISRGIWKQYNSRLPETWLLARGLHLGLLDRSQIADDLWEMIEPELDTVRELAKGRPT